MDNIPGSGILGFGFNVLGTYNMNSVTAMIVNAPSGSNGTYTFNGTEYNVPQNVSVSPGAGDETTQGQAYVAQSQQEFQSYLAAKAGISGSYQGFKGEFNAAFSQETQSQSVYWYGVVAGSYEALIVLLQNYSSAQLSANFTQDPDVQALLQLQSPQFNPSTQQLFFTVFQKWGTHLVTKVVLGGNINYFSAVNSTFSSDDTTISANLSLEYKAVFVDAAAQASADWKTLGQTWANDRSVSIAATGGNSDLLQALAPDFDSNFSSIFNQWDQSIMSQPQVINFALTPLNDVFSGALGQAVSDALTAYLNAGVYVQADYFMNSGSAYPNTLNGLIMVGASTMPSSPPQNGAFCSAQLVVIDPTTLQPIVNVSGSLTPSQIGSNYAAAYDLIWTPFLKAAQAVTEQSYIVGLSLNGFNVASGFPAEEFATWLQACGATLDNWKNVLNQYCGNDYFVSYAFVGQQGLLPGGALEKFNSDLTAYSSSQAEAKSYGDCFANVTAPLIQTGSGSYSIAVPATATPAAA
jgi:hypothetical protein